MKAARRLDLEYHTPKVIRRNPRIKSGGDEAKQKAFIESYDDLLNSLADNEAVVFADAVHPTHAARRRPRRLAKRSSRSSKQAGVGASTFTARSIFKTGQPSAGYSNRLRLLEPLACFARMIEIETIDAASTIKLLESIEALYPMLVLIYVFRANARYHPALLPALEPVE
jgi:hypothetical protein